MGFSRAAGILLHPTSLPGPGGIGTLGKNAYAFLDTLHAAKVSLWQVLPLGPTGYGDSPYSALSAFAGNPYLIALDSLVARGWLEPDDLRPLAPLPESRVDFGRLVQAKMSVLRCAYERFRDGGSSHAELDAFVHENASWLEDFTLYMAVKDAHGGAPWNEWEESIRLRRPEALDAARSALHDQIAFHRFVQGVFFGEWDALKRHANSLGIKIIGDIPIFVAYDSADVWAHQELFQLDGAGRPVVVAGVPPDYFSATGQLWGNPHYHWEVMARTGYSWWIDRFRMILRLVDIVRLDHFRGFAGAWQIPYGNSTAEIGEWVPGPGASLFEAVRDALGILPIIAEDLGVITPDVDALRLAFGFPGMQILQFAFGSDPENGALPHNFERNTVVYTGTHDNDTTVGWWMSIDEPEREAVRRYLGRLGADISWELMRLAFASVADLAIVPLTDVLRAGTRSRMNLPGRPEGNWSWRYVEGAITEAEVAALGDMIETYGRTLSGEETPTSFS
jgi:4-alpha-glucanotransferase